MFDSVVRCVVAIENVTYKLNSILPFDFHTCFWGFFCGYRGFCNRTESDLVLSIFCIDACSFYIAVNLFIVPLGSCQIAKYPSSHLFAEYKKRLLRTLMTDVKSKRKTNIVLHLGCLVKMYLAILQLLKIFELV